MEVTGHTIPLQRETIREMAPRFNEALCGTFDPSSDDFVPEEERTKADTRKHLFDFMDSMRLTVSLHNSEDGLVIHGYARWFESKSRPNRREEGLKQVLKRMALLIESLDRVNECPDPVEAGLSEQGVPHAFFPYPSPIFEPA